MPLSKLLLDLANGPVEEAPSLRRKPSEGLALEVPGRCKFQDTAPQTFWRRAAIDPFPKRAASSLRDRLGSAAIAWSMSPVTAIGLARLFPH